MSLPTTTADAIRETLVAKIKRIKPRRLRDQGKRWRHIGNDERAEVAPGSELRTFDVLLDAEVGSFPGGYGGGITMVAPARVRVSYPREADEMYRLAGADAQDLTAVLFSLHHDLDGLWPVETVAGLALLDARLVADGPLAYVVDLVIAPGLKFFASDTVTLFPG